MMAALALLALAPAQAGADCANARTQLQMNGCATRDFGRADAELNRQWTATLGRIRKSDSYASKADRRPSGEARLRQAQRAWLVFRDAHCAVAGYEARGGSMEPMIYDNCRAELTRARTRQLRELATER